MKYGTLDYFLLIRYKNPDQQVPNRSTQKG